MREVAGSDPAAPIEIRPTAALLAAVLLTLRFTGVISNSVVLLVALSLTFFGSLYGRRQWGKWNRVLDDEVPRRRQSSQSS